MVHKLHKRGNQRLRIVPGMSPSGMHWRVCITPISNILRTLGAIAVEYGRLSALYSSADENRFFGWYDAREATSRELADRFERRFTEIAAAGLGQDWAYAGWYVAMLGAAEGGALPVAYADWYERQAPDRLATTKSEVSLPLPPPGEADDSGASEG